MSLNITFFQRLILMPNSLILVLFLLSFDAYGQVFTASEINSRYNELDSDFKDYELFSLPTDEVLSYVRNRNFNSDIRFRLGNHDWDLELYENTDIIGGNYVATVVTEEGKTQSNQRPTVKPFYGFVKGTQNKVRLSFDEHFIFGFVVESETEHFFIEPLNRFKKNAPNDVYVVYNVKDVKSDGTAACGVTEADIQKAGIISHNHSNNQRQGACAGGCEYVEYAVATDYSMFQKYGSISALQNYIVATLNNVEADYTGFFASGSGGTACDIEFVIVEQYMIACEGCDEWTTSTDAGTLLSSHLNWGNAGNFSVNYDLSTIWTNRDFNGGTVGIAYVGVVCSGSRYSAFQDFTSNAQSMRVMVTHEFGHNFNAPHNYAIGSACDPPGRTRLIMDPVVDPTAVAWSTGAEACAVDNIATISDHIGSRTCLATCVPDACDNTLVSGMTISSINSTGADLTWTDNGTNYRVRARFAQTDTWTYTNTETTNSASVPLNPCSTYEIQVQNDCGGGSYGPATTFTVISAGLEITSTNVVNCNSGTQTYDLEIVVTHGFTSGNFTVNIDGVDYPQTYTASPQTVTITGLPSTGNAGIPVIVSDDTTPSGICYDQTTYTAARSECTCSSLQSENFDACSLPAGWTNNATGANGAADWDFGNDGAANQGGANNIDGTCMAYFDDDAIDNDGGEVMELISPNIDLTGNQDVSIEFDFNFRLFGAGFFNVDYWNGSAYVNVLNQTANNCGQWGTCTYPHFSYAVPNSDLNANFNVRFTFSDGNSWEYYAGIDNFELCGYTPACNLDILSITETNCDGVNGTHDLEVQVEFSNEGASGFSVNIDGTDYSFAHTTSPQTVTVTGLTNDFSLSTVYVADNDNPTICRSVNSSYTTPFFSCVPVVLLDEDFDACSLPAGWTNTALGSNGAADWDFDNDGANIAGTQNLDGTCMAHFDDDDIDNNGGEIMELISPVIDLSSYVFPVLTFDYNYRIENGGFFRVQVFDGTSWVTELDVTTNDCGTWGCTYPQASIDLSAYGATAKTANFQVKFIFDDGNGWQWYAGVDNVRIEGYLNLPVELMSFTGKAERKANVLDWTTASEENSSHFEVQRSSQANREFTSIGEVTATGNSLEQVDYSFIDENRLIGRNYYRLKMVDFDGSFEYSNIILLNNDNNHVNIYPNPAKNNVFIDYQLENTNEINIQILNELGQVVMNNNSSTNDKRGTLEIDVNHLASGVYFIKIESGNYTHFEKILRL